jgi:hypothetical protein
MSDSKESLLVPGGDSQVSLAPDEARSLKSTVSHQLFEGLLTTYYVPLEIWYIRTIIDKVCSPLLTYTIFTDNAPMAGSSAVQRRYFPIARNHDDS